MKKIYLSWLALHTVVWILAFMEFSSHLNELRLASLSLFLAIFFLTPLFREKSIIQMILFSIQALITTILFYPINQELNPYVLFIHSFIIVEAMLYLSRLKSLVVIFVHLGCATIIMISTNLGALQLAWIALFYLLLITSSQIFQFIHKREIDTRSYNGALMDEYRRMKRQLVIEEEQARQDERMLIGHEIHDSVGHKLTALLLQFEVFRLTASEKDKEIVGKLKTLAEESLEETRQAVKSFKQREVGGLQGVIQLIRKLEMESFMKVQFSVKHGAFAAPLTGEQSFAIYRAVQEALTNIMKHSNTREAQVTFESPGGSIFRFEVINSTVVDSFYQEGFGLTAMRERIEKVGGTLEIEMNEHQFIVRGIIRLIKAGG